jgi:hypothetical protein
MDPAPRVPGPSSQQKPVKESIAFVVKVLASAGIGGLTPEDFRQVRADYRQHLPALCPTPQSQLSDLTVMALNT